MRQILTARMRAVVAVGTVLLLGLAPAILASDGVIEINQASANVGGIVPGDAPGFPVTLTQPGSYILTSNLIVPSANSTAIEIDASHVTVDLNGFSIVGPTVCDFEGCSPTGTGSGISAYEGSFPYPSSTTVRNGSIRGMGHRGIDLEANAHVEDVHATSNGDTGIRIWSDSVVTNSTATVNGAVGISTSNGCVVTHNTAVGNLAGGIFAAQGSTVSYNTARGNLGIGIDVNTGSLVTGNAAWQNLGAGIDAGEGATVTNNTSRDNGGYGLDLDAGAGYGGNVLTDNTAGTVTAAGVQIGVNLCGTDTSCP
jgi:hypothetical protein